MKQGKRKAMAEGALKEAGEAFEKAKAQVRALVDHPFHILKNLFKHRKTRYRGLSKDTVQLHTLFALVNLNVLLFVDYAQHEAVPLKTGAFGNWSAGWMIAIVTETGRELLQISYIGL